MFQIRWTIDGRKKFARHRGGKIIRFEKRQQARQYIRNHHLYLETNLVIIHPDGTEEPQPCYPIISRKA